MAKRLPIGNLQPKPHVWEAIGRDAGLRRVLEDFYARVYADARLAPFFVRTTMDWAIDHQFAFLKQILTGEDVFFGDRPRNAHHWMVISDELFDYREELMQRVLAEHGVSEPVRVEWRAMEEVFRKQIVKDAPFPKKRGGKELPLEGYEYLLLSLGAVCDGCGAFLEEGDDSSYHVRLGHLFCVTCVPLEGVKGAPVR